MFMLNRFNQITKSALLGMNIIPFYVNKHDVTTEDLEWFLPDLPHPQTLEQELHRWKVETYTVPFVVMMCRGHFELKVTY